GSWCWPTTGPTRPGARPMSIWSWPAWARRRCCSPSACWRAWRGAIGSPPSPPAILRTSPARSWGCCTRSAPAPPPARCACGAGSKAGLVPLHAWLPLAHPAAPSQVSALMSGAMTKIALYAIIRVLFDLVGSVGWWVGVLLLVLGAASAVMGVLYGLFQRDLKTLLAYSTVENIGIIAIGLGLAQLFRADNLPILAALALTAALFHCISHAMLKSLLFCGAGAVLNATGLRDIERLGALIHRMPVTAAAMLVGAAGLS